MDNVFAKVANFCHNNLLNDKDIMTYLTKKRKINIESINKFNIGLFPKNINDLFKIADPKDLRDSSIIRNASFSTFSIQNLVMPIMDVYGKPIALAGRTLIPEKDRKEKGIPKYKNSIYKKSYHLFGLNLAKRSIIKNGIAYVVEGYFDVIMPHQKGLDNVVATCGAFLSFRHVALLSRYANKIVLLLDNEIDAQEKAKKIVERRQYNGINITSENPLDDAKDIDEYLRNHTVKDLLANLEGEYGCIKPLWD